MAVQESDDEKIFTDPRVDPEYTQGQTRTRNLEVREGADERSMSATMKWGLFLTIGAVFVVGPCLVLLAFGGLAELLEGFGLQGVLMLPR